MRAVYDTDGHPCRTLHGGESYTAGMTHRSEPQCQRHPLAASLPSDQTENGVERWGRRFVTSILGSVGMMIGSAGAYTVWNVVVEADYGGALAGVQLMFVVGMIGSMCAFLAFRNTEFVPETGTWVRTLAVGALLGAAVFVAGKAYS